jgi:hypothetical protein
LNYVIFKIHNVWIFTGHHYDLHNESLKTQKNNELLSAESIDWWVTMKNEWKIREYTRTQHHNIEGHLDVYNDNLESIILRIYKANCLFLLSIERKERIKMIQDLSVTKLIDFRRSNRCWIYSLLVSQKMIRRA